MRSSRLMFVVICLAVVAATPALAEMIHAGVSIGQSFMTADPRDYNEAWDQGNEIDENSTAWKIFAGVNFPGFLGVEGAYRNFGTVDGDVEGTNFEYKTKGFDIQAVGRVQVAVLEVFAKAGFMFWNADLSVDDLEFDDDGSDFIYGVGAGIDLGGIGVRVEWETLNADHADNLSMVSLGASMGF